MWTNSMYDTTKLTVELGQVVDSGVDIWDFDYPSYYEGQERADFEQKVIDHYRFHQIGVETVGRWLHNFRTRMREIMPYYIQRYKSVAIMEAIEDPFGNVDVTETYTREATNAGTNLVSASDSSTNNSTTNTSASGSDDSTHKLSNTPQGSISNLDSYLTEASVDSKNTTDQAEATSNISTSGSSESEGSHTDTSEESYTLTRKGNQGVNTYAHDMKELRETFINVDLEIINELKDLFLMVY